MEPCGVLAGGIAGAQRTTRFGIVGAASKHASTSTPTRAMYVVGEPMRPCHESPKTREKPTSCQRKHRSTAPERTCVRIEVVDLARSSPASKRPRAGIMRSTSIEEISTHAVSAWSTQDDATIVSRSRVWKKTWVLVQAVTNLIIV